MKNVVVILRISMIGFLLFGGFGCVVKQNKPQAAASEIVSDPLTRTFAEMDYQVKSKRSESPTDWEKEQFQMSGKTVYSVKRRTMLEGVWKDVYPRFEVTEEVFADEQSAEARLERIQEKPPNLPVEQDYYWMVTGFQRQKNVYFIQTDGTIFEESMKDFAGKLDKELSRDILNR